MRFLKWILGLFVLCLIGAFFYFKPLLKVGTGYAAKMACSCHFIQDRSLADIKEHDLNYSALPLIDLEADEETKTIYASFFGLIHQEARYVQGRGCILRANLENTLPAPLEHPKRGFEIPDLMRTYDTLPEGLDLALLEAAVDSAFLPVAGGGSRGVVVLYEGNLVFEQYAPGFDKNTPLLGWSMTKSMTNALVGIMVKNGLLQLDQDKLFPEWEADERAKITLADLLHMNSGLQWNEAYGGVSDATRMLYLQDDMAAYAIGKDVVFEPNTEWVYSSGTTNILTSLIKETLDSEETYYALARDSLFLQLGMSSAMIECDQSGTLVGSSYGWATARDWARFGQLYLQDGIWNGKTILPTGWVDFSTEIAAGSTGNYGAQIWLKDEEVLPNAPDDTFLFRGYQDQRVFIIPSRKCVIVRLGMNDDKQFPFDELIRSVLLALPE